MSTEDKFTLSYSKKEHNRKSHQHELNRDDLVLNGYGSVDNMKHFVGPAFIMCIYNLITLKVVHMVSLQEYIKVQEK